MALLASVTVDASPSPRFENLYQELHYVKNNPYFSSSQKAVDAIELYLNTEDTFYREINSYLRFYPKPYDWFGTSPESAKEIVRAIDSIFTRVPFLPADINLYRGIDLAYRKTQPLQIGEELFEKAYLSTSLEQSVAIKFSKNQFSKGHIPTVFKLYFDNPHQKGILLYTNEDEVLLPRRRRLRIMKKMFVSPEYSMFLVQVCSDLLPCSHTIPSGLLQN